MKETRGYRVPVLEPSVTVIKFNEEWQPDDVAEFEGKKSRYMFPIWIGKTKRNNVTVRINQETLLHLATQLLLKQTSFNVRLGCTELLVLVQKFQHNCN